MLRFEPVMVLETLLQHLISLDLDLLAHSFI
jgi:hypothetical protein